jgi:Fe-S oxidoreductase
VSAVAADLRVALFATCFNDTMWPGTPKAVVRLLERLGVRVEFPMAQTCCGQMLTNTGYARRAPRGAARRALRRRLRGLRRGHRTLGLVRRLGP